MKSLEEFVELFAEQFDETDASEITADKNFRELVEWSSRPLVGWVGSRAGAWWFENWIVDASRGRPFGGVFCC